METTCDILIDQIADTVDYDEYLPVGLTKTGLCLIFFGIGAVRTDNIWRRSIW